GRTDSGSDHGPGTDSRNPGLNLSVPEPERTHWVKVEFYAAPQAGDRIAGVDVSQVAETLRQAFNFRYIDGVTVAAVTVPEQAIPAAVVLPVLEALQADFDSGVMSPRDVAVMRTAANAAAAAERHRMGDLEQAQIDMRHEAERRDLPPCPDCGC